MRAAATLPAIRGRVDARLTVAALAAGVLAVVAALQWAEQGWRPAVILLAGGAGAVVLVLLAAARFEAFALTTLAVRAAADWTQSGGDLVAHPMNLGGAGAPLAMLFLLASVVWLAAESRRLGRPRRSPLSRALLLLTLACLVSVPGSLRPVVSLAESIRFLSAAMMFVVLERLLAGGETTVRRVLYACYASTLVPLAIGVTDLLTGSVATEDVSGFSRLEASFAHPNAYGFYLALIVVMSVALLPHLAGGHRLGLAALLAIAFGQLVLTYSRGGWITALVGLLVVGVFQSRRLLVVLIAGCVALPIAVPSIAARLSDLDDERTVRGTGGNSLVWRVDHWTDSLRLVDQRPLTGIGLKMTTFATAAHKAPHNDYVRMYVEVGVLGLAAYLGLLGALILTARRALAAARRGPPRGIAVGFAACVAGFVVVSVASNRITSVVELWYFFALAAAAQGIAGTRRSPA